MTPTFLWVFLLALVGRTASVPRPLTVDACALICNPGAETEAERERDPTLYPRYPKVNCRLQSKSDEDQAWVIASQCLKLCNVELSISMEVNCFALRSSLGANLGCFCEALTPLSPNTMRLHESWRLNFLVKELAQDILTVILLSDLDTLILCEIKQELLGDRGITEGTLYEKCKSYNESLLHDRSRRSVDEDSPLNDSPVDLNNDDERHEFETDDFIAEAEKLDEMETHDETELLDEVDNFVGEEIVDIMGTAHEEPLRTQSFIEDTLQENTFKKAINDWQQACSSLCKDERGPDYCRCDNLHKV